MAILDYVKLYKDKGQESWGKLQGRQKLIFAGIGIGIVALFFVMAFAIGGGSGGMVPLKVTVADPTAAVRKLAIFGIKSNFSDKEKALVVEEEHELRAARILSSAKLLPNGDQAYGFVAESNLAQTDAARQLQYRVELQKFLADTIGAMNGIDTATVNLTPPSRPFFYRFNKEDLRAKASVMVQTTDANRLTQVQVMAIAQLIAGSMETMNTENVNISDLNGNTYPIDEKWRQAFSMMEVAAKAQADVENNAERVLRSYKPSVAAVIKVRTGATRSKERTVDDKTKGIDAKTQSREESSLNTKLLGTAGQEGNAGRDRVNDPGRAEVDSKHNLEENLTVKDYSWKETEHSDDADKPDYENSTIAVTISDEFELSNEKMDELRQTVSKATNIPLNNVQLTQVPAIQANMESSGFGGPWGELLKPESIVKVVLLLLAISAFIALTVMMKKSAPKPLTLVDDEFVEEDEEPLPEVPTLPPVDQLSGNLVREKVVDLVRKNPKAAANLIKRWVIIGK